MAIIEAADIAVSGACSLAEAIQNANDDAQTNTDCAAGSGADTITLSADITLGAALPSITSNITIIGVGFHTISGNDSYRVLHVANGGDLTLQWVSINDGSADVGAGLLVESGGEAELQNVGFQDNSATGSGGSGGGAIKAQGNVTIFNSFFLRNTAPFGGAIDNAASMNIYSSRFHGNGATSYGGAIMTQATGSVFMVNSVVYLSEGSGGAIRLLDTSSGIIHFSAVLDNSSSGIVVGWPTGAHTPQLNLVSSIVAGNNGSECQVVSGSIESNVSNLIEDGSCSATLRGDPRLLKDTRNVFYYDLLPNSPAIDAAQYCGLGNVAYGFDIRGVTRPQGSACDIGAREYVHSSPRRPEPEPDEPEPDESSSKPTHEERAIQDRKELLEEYNIEVIGPDFVSPKNVGSSWCSMKPELRFGCLDAVDLNDGVSGSRISGDDYVDICFPETESFLVLIKKGVPETMEPLNTCWDADDGKSCARVESEGTVAAIPMVNSEIFGNSSDWFYNELKGSTFETNSCLRAAPEIPDRQPPRPDPPTRPTLDPPPPRLITCEKTVTIVNGLRLRECPSTRCRIIAELARGQELTVIGGPTDASGYIWWQVSATTISGWMAEGVTVSEGNYHYFLAPVDEPSDPEDPADQAADDAYTIHTEQPDYISTEYLTDSSQVNNREIQAIQPENFQDAVRVKEDSFGRDVIGSEGVKVCFEPKSGRKASGLLMLVAERDSSELDVLYAWHEGDKLCTGVDRPGTIVRLDDTVETRTLYKKKDDQERIEEGAREAVRRTVGIFVDAALEVVGHELTGKVTARLSTKVDDVGLPIAEKLAKRLLSNEKLQEVSAATLAELGKLGLEELGNGMRDLYRSDAAADLRETQYEKIVKEFEQSIREKQWDEVYKAALAETGDDEEAAKEKAEALILEMAADSADNLIEDMSDDIADAAVKQFVLDMTPLLNSELGVSPSEASADSTAIDASLLDETSHVISDFLFAEGVESGSIGDFVGDTTADIVGNDLAGEFVGFGTDVTTALVTTSPVGIAINTGIFVYDSLSAIVADKWAHQNLNDCQITIAEKTSARTHPNTFVRAVMTKGASVQAVARTQNWIKFTDSNGVPGWVKADSVDTSGDCRFGTERGSLANIWYELTNRGSVGECTATVTDQNGANIRQRPIETTEHVNQIRGNVSYGTTLKVTSRSDRSFQVEGNGLTGWLLQIDVSTSGDCN